MAAHNRTPGPPRSQALDASFSQIRKEFDGIAREVDILRSQRDEYELNVTSQVNELNIIRRALYDLEAQHGTIRRQYEDEIAHLRAQLASARRHGGGGGGPPDAVRPGPADDARPSPDDDDRKFPPSASAAARKRKYDDAADPDSAMPIDDGPSDRLYPAPRDGRSFNNDRGPPPPRESRRDGRPPEDGPGGDLLLRRPEPRHNDSGRDAMSPPLSNRPATIPPRRGGMDASPTLPPRSEQKGSVSRNGDASSSKKEVGEWAAVWSPKSTRNIDISLTHTLPHDSIVCCVRFSPDGRYLATGCNRSAQIYDAQTGKKLCTLVDESATPEGDLFIRSVCFSPDGRYLATGAEDKLIRIWDVGKQYVRHVFRGHEQEIMSIQFSFDGRFIVSGSGDRTVRIWDTRTAEGTNSASPPDSLTKTLAISERQFADSGVTCVALSHDGAFVACGALDGVVRVWDVKTGTLVERLWGHQDSVFTLVFTPDGKGLLSGSMDRTVKCWDVHELGRRGPVGASWRLQDKRKGGENGTPPPTEFVGHKDFVLAVAISSDGRWVVTGSKDRAVQFWDAKTTTPQVVLEGHKNSVISVDLASAGGLLASGSGDAQARIWTYRPLPSRA